ncbi:30S ribosomal protein S8 [Candidatus Woesearchaeota archaeon]|nr:30S ribosomal protein S8 [Candidatus Woesearchaeota archaeon]
MAMNDPVSAALSAVMNAERRGKSDVHIKPYSKVVTKVLDILAEEHYVGSYEAVPDGRGGFLRLSLLGSINKCGAIKPRFILKTGDFERFERRFLPAQGFGLLVISTSKGMMVHSKAKELGIGGKLIAYCY